MRARLHSRGGSITLSPYRPTESVLLEDYESSAPAQDFTTKRPPCRIDPMRPLPTRTGLPRLDLTSWEKGFADGFNGQVWWPGPGTEPLSYSSGYTEAQADPDPKAELTASSGKYSEAIERSQGFDLGK
jgi:hypothetical protein